MPDLAAKEARFEEAFATALEMPEDSEPMHIIQAWSMVLMSATMLERVRARAGGQSAGDHEAVAERVLERWQRLRPEAGGPDLFRAFRIENPAAKRAAVLALLDRYPDDPLVTWQASSELRQAGEVGRATEVAEVFLVRNPDHPLAYRILAQTVMENETRLAAVLERWAHAAPGDPALVTLWMRSNLRHQDTGATQRMLAEFFARRPAGAAGLNACLEVMRSGDPSFARPVRTCVARIAGDPDVPANVTERATAAMAEVAAADGDWSAVVTALDSLQPEARLRALVAAARTLETPQRCGERLELLSVAAQALGADDRGYASIGFALQGCSDQPAAETLYLSLLRQAPADEVPEVLRARVTKVNQIYRGELPMEAAVILEQRLLAEPDEEGLYAALDVVYRLADPGGRRFDLLRRWHQRAPSSFRSEQAADLAWKLRERGQPEAAVELLGAQIESRFDSDLAEMLWALYRETAGAEQAERFAADLIASGNPWRAAAGHLLAARSAVLLEDLTTAEGHYWKALEGDHPQPDVAVELLYMVARRGGVAALETMARRVCEQTSLAADADAVPGCAADLLTRAGSGAAAASFLAAQSADLPEDLQSLRELASTARTAGQAEVAERALRRILELDPRDDAGWIDYGAFLEQQGRVEDLEVLLERSRETFSPPPTGLYRSTGRALAAAGRPRRAIDVLLEARAALPEGEGGEYSRRWIDHDLRQAYQRLGQQTQIAVPRTGPAPIRAFGTSRRPVTPEGSARELRIAADALRSGEGGQYDPDAAAGLYARAAAMGDPLATSRLAIIRQLDAGTAPPGGKTAEELWRRSAPAVEAQAAAGDAYAQYLVGTAALSGLGGAADFAAARRWLEAAAAQGESFARHNLAWMAQTGRGFERPDPAAALASYRRASEAGNAESMVSFAQLTLTFYGSGAPCAEGLRWLERAARTGHAGAAAFLGKLLFYGRGECVARDPQAALGWLETGAGTHQPGAAYDLAMALLLGGGDEASRARGAGLLEEAASRADVLAVETLAFLHATGIGVPRDLARARQLVEQAARLGSDGFYRLRESRGSEVYRELFEQGMRLLEALAEEGDPAAMALLARLQSVGLGGEVEPERWAELARRAAEAGEPMAMRILSSAYEQGPGVEPDPALARRWQRRCAEAGNAFCMMFLGHALIEGEQPERDREAGLAWLHRAAEAGHWWAIADLGYIYAEGRYGVARDPEEAAGWKRRLADLGDPEAAGWLLYHGYR